MNLDVKDIVVLEDKKEYVIASKMKYDNKTYYYMADTSNISNFKFCYEDNNELVEVLDKNKLEKLALLFSKKLLEDLKNIN